MKKSIYLIILLTTFSMLFSCSSGYGDKLEFNKTEVYFTKKVSKDEAQKLGEYLVKSEFADGNSKSVQLTKNDSGNYIFKMVAKEGVADNEMYIVLAKIVAKQFSDSIFNKTPVEYHFCDNKFNTLRKVPFEK